MSISSRLKELKEKREQYDMELDDLHMAEPSERWYKARRHEIESQIAMIDDAIEDLEHEQRMMRPFFWTTVGFGVVVCGMLLYYLVKTKM